MNYLNDIDLKKTHKHFLHSTLENWRLMLTRAELQRYQLWQSRTRALPEDAEPAPEPNTPAGDALRDAAALYRQLLELDHARALANRLVVALPEPGKTGLRLFSVGPLGIYCVVQLSGTAKSFCSAYRVEGTAETHREFTRLYFIMRGLDKLHRLLRAHPDEPSANAPLDVLTEEDMTKLRSYLLNYLTATPIPEQRFARMLDTLFQGDTPQITHRVDVMTVNEKAGLVRYAGDELSGA